jgi:hypothetical protein
VSPFLQILNYSIKLLIINKILIRIIKIFTKIGNKFTFFTQTISNGIATSITIYLKYLVETCKHQNKPLYKFLIQHIKKISYSYSPLKLFSIPSHYFNYRCTNTIETFDNFFIRTFQTMKRYLPL